MDGPGAGSFPEAIPYLLGAVLFVFGEVRGQRGLFRSDDGGRRWRRIDGDALRFGGIIRHVTGDPRLHGRVYFGTEGRGIWYGDPE